MNQPFSLPVYFQPLPGLDSANTQPTFVPSHILDIFVMRDPRSRRTEQIIVLGCLTGSIQVITTHDVHGLDAQLRNQIHSAEVSMRNQFRTITATNLTIATLDALEQQVQTHGLNDAVSLYGAVFFQLGFVQGRIHVTSCMVRGHVTVGRVDALNGCELGSQHPFYSPHGQGEQIRHLLLPAAPLEQIQHGQGLMLMYPFLDPLKIQSTDNTFIVLRLIYDLLTHLQQDMQHEGVEHAYTHASIPVPSRRQLEAELTADGYRIDGDSAFRQHTSTTNSSATTMLGRLRLLTHAWLAPRILVPPQATLNDYVNILQQLLPAITSQADTAMMQALAACIGAPTTVPQSSASMSAPTPASQSSAGVATTRLTPTAHVQPPPPVSHRDWSADFGSPQPSPPQHAWWSQNTHKTTEVSVLSKDDWLRDFLASSNVYTPGTRPNDAQAEGNRWADDFQASPTNESSNDWSDDFGSKT